MAKRLKEKKTDSSMNPKSSTTRNTAYAEFLAKYCPNYEEQQKQMRQLQLKERDVIFNPGETNKLMSEMHKLGDYMFHSALENYTNEIKRNETEEI